MTTHLRKGMGILKCSVDCLGPKSQSISEPERKLGLPTSKSMFSSPTPYWIVSCL